MKLRSQMLLAGALTLAVPLVGWQSVKQLYASLQQTRIDEQTLKVANMRLALSEAEDVKTALDVGLTAQSAIEWYAETASYPLFVDGYADDWQTLVNRSIRYQRARSAATIAGHQTLVSVRSARKGDRLYLFIKVNDDEVIYHQPPLLKSDAGEGELPDPQTLLVNGDAIELLIQTSEGIWQHGLLRAIAPGPLQALTASAGLVDQAGRIVAGTRIAHWQAAWVAAAGGYQVEINVPLPPMGTAIGLSVIDVDQSAASRDHFVGNISPRSMASVHASGQLDNAEELGLLFHESDGAKERLKRWTTGGVRARLFDVNGRLVADVNKLNTVNNNQDELDAQASSSTGILSAVLHRVFAFFIAGDLPLLPETYPKSTVLALEQERRASISGESPLTTRYVTPENDRVLGTLAPLGRAPLRGYLLLEANEEHSSAYGGSQLAQLFSLLLLVSLLAGSGLLIFATVLSLRIRRLSREAQHAITDDGRVRGLTGSDARDEIGDLSRKLSSLLSRSAAYTHYLEALSGRLSHELRTPLSVVRTSIENLDKSTLDEQSRLLIDRASGGAEQLKSIIQALVESTRLEQTVQMAQMQSVDLADWLQGSLLRYQQLYPACHIVHGAAALTPLTVNASPELLQQAFDKLVDNAVSFCIDKQIVLHVYRDPDAHSTSEPQSVVIAVENTGPLIDEVALGHLFDPMYSQREQRHDELHLGLGLYIVRMIAEAHGGGVFAQNRQASVIIGMKIPSA